MIAIDGVSMTYKARGKDVHALENVSLDVEDGEFISLVGPSGCGKSTLLKIVGDLVRPTVGSVTVDGVPSSEARRHGAFSFAFQNPVLLPWRRVIENVQLPLELLHKQANDPLELLRLVGLSAFAHSYPFELSGGMQQRVALARALTFKPKLLLMDEPFGALDEITRDALNLELLRIRAETNVAVLFVTHSIAEAVFMSDRVVVMSARPGRIRAMFDVDLPRPRTDETRHSPRLQELTRWIRDQLESGK
jgi:NitT/TauT family transport system ATP-binding protein